MSRGNWREFDDSSPLKPFASKSVQDKSERKVRVQKTKGGKGGKTVTVITGLELDQTEAKLLLKTLKSRCGSGGTVKGDFLELQGDQVDLALQLLRNEGYQPKKSGG